MIYHGERKSLLYSSFEAEFKLNSNNYDLTSRPASWQLHPQIISKLDSNPEAVHLEAMWPKVATSPHPFSLPNCSQLQCGCITLGYSLSAAHFPTNQLCVNVELKKSGREKQKDLIEKHVCHLAQFACK